MRDLLESGPAADVPPPGPPTDYLPPAPQTLRGPWSSPTNFPVSVCIPGYELLGELGRGGMGVVFKAKHVGLNRLVALKVMLNGLFASAAEKARFRLEAESVARLHHPNVVQVYDVGEHGGIAFIAFEFVEGPTLRSWQNGKPIEPRQAAALAAQIARAMQHAHGARIVHRDLKPANILLAKPGEVNGYSSAVAAPRSPFTTLQPKVTDFGLAKPLEGAADLTASGATCGTPNYMAPEQVRGGPGGTAPSADIWGIGALLFELLTGRPPFVGTDAATIMNDILMSEPPPVSLLEDGVPRDLGVIVAKCLEKDASRRYLTAGDIADDLERFLKGEQILARPIGTTRRAARWVTRNPLVAGFVTALALGLLGVTLVAIALMRSVSREHAAVAREGMLHKQADEATAAAERAHRETRAALARVEETLTRARIETRRTDDALRRAESEKKRAEENFVIARNAVKHVVDVIHAIPGDDRAPYFPLFRELLVGVEPFLGKFLDQKAGDPEIRFEQALIARDLGGIEADLGRFEESRAYFLRSAALSRDLLEKSPWKSEYLQTLGYSLAMAGSVSQDHGKPDASALLQTGLKELVEHAKRHPCEPEGVECLIRVHLAMSTVDGPDATDEHDRAVLELVEHQEKALGRQLRLTRLRAHALNNIASRLTNRGKTDEAEMYWRQVLAIREKLAGAAPYSKVYQFELATCLFNYANQLQKTERSEEARASREHAAKLYDPIRNDARKRTMYIPVIVRNDLLLADASSRRGETGKSIDRLTVAIELNKLVIDRNPTNLGSRAAHADALTARAELLEALGHHAEAASDLRAAISFSTRESHKDYCATKLVCVLVRSGQRAEAMTLAAELDPEKFTPPWLCVECARGWMLIARATANAQSIPPEEKEKTVAMAQTRARAAILAARKKGMFHEADEAKWFLSQKDFEPIWDVVARAKQ